MSEKALLLWSGGKDSALALHEARQRYDIVTLLTTVTEAYDRVSMHGVRTRLLQEQADALGLPVDRVPVPVPCCNADYEAGMHAALARHRREGVALAVA